MTFEIYGNTITIEQGSTFSLSLNWADSSGDTLTLSTDNYTARMMGRVGRESSSTLFSWATGSEIVLANSNPNIVITAAATATDDLPAPTEGVYDLELVSAAGVVSKILKGRLRIEREVTR